MIPLSMPRRYTFAKHFNCRLAANVGIYLVGLTAVSAEQHTITENIDDPGNTAADLVHSAHDFWWERLASRRHTGDREAVFDVGLGLRHAQRPPSIAM